jgi:hypothetical protein
MLMAGAALAQQPDEQPSPKNKKQEKAHAAEANPRANVAKPQGAVMKQRGAMNERAAAKTQNVEATRKSAKAARTETNVAGKPAATATPEVKQHAEQNKKGMKAPAANAKVSATPAPTAAATAAPAVSATTQRRGQANPAAAAKKPAPEKVQEIKKQHANFHAQPKPQQVPAVTFQQNYRIQGSDRWQGRQYEAFRSYHPERHDRG